MNLAGELYRDRASGAADYSLIADSFKKNVAMGERNRRNWTHAEAQRALLDRILLLAETQCRVLVGKDSPASIAGWVAWTPLGPELVAIHYMFVKRNVRPLGCAEALFALTGAEDKRLIWTFGGQVAEKICGRLVTAGRVREAGHIPPAEFLMDMGDKHERRSAQG